MTTMQGGTVLLLEDDDGVRDLVTLVLEKEGHAVRPCQSPREILDAARTAKDAVAVVDFWGSSYVTLHAEERDQLVEFARAVPTVLITGRDWAQEATAQELGLAALLPKPFNVVELSEIVRDCVAQVQADSEAPTRR